MSFTEKLIEKYAKAFDSIEIEVIEGDSKSVDIRDGEIEDISVNSSTSVKVRVFKDGRTLYYTAGGINEERLNNFFSEAGEVILLTENDENTFIPHSADVYEELSFLPEPDIEELKNNALLTENSAKSFDKRITSVKSASCSYVNTKTLLTGTHINSKQWNRQYISSFCQCLAEENGDIQEGYEGETVILGKAFDPSFSGRKSAETAVSLLGGTALKTADYHILFDSGIAAQFLELLSEMCDGESVIKHMTMFEDMLNQAVASKIINITDDPFHPDAIGSYKYDDEGTPAKLTKLIKGGVLKSFLHNSYTANVLNQENTANAERTGSGKIGTGISNLVLTPTDNFNKIADIKGDVVKVLDVMGLHTADTVSGDFSLGISGVVLNGGVVKHAFRESVLTGNLRDLLLSAIAVYDNTRIHGKIVTGDILFDKMIVSGS